MKQEKIILARCYKISIFVVAIAACMTSCNSSFVKATFGNRNVYKTKMNLPVKKVYEGNRPSNDPREYVLTPNVVPAVGKTKRTITTTINKVDETAIITTVTVSANPPAPTITKIVSNPAGATAITSPYSSYSISDSTYSYPAPPRNINFIRYKVVADDGDFKYIRVLPGCTIGTAPNDDEIVIGKGEVNASNYIFQVAKKALVPNTHYLASSALIGKITTLPLRMRKQHWDNDNTVLEGSLSIGYSFGYKLKIGNHPYRPHYVNLIIYGAGISQQSYFYLEQPTASGKQIASSKSNEIAITFLSSGVTYEFEKFNIGIFAGKDKMFGKLRNWAYQDSWWFGLGIGYELFK